MKTFRKILKRVVTLAVLVAVGYFGWMYYESRNAEEEEASIGRIPTQEASVRDITVSVSATGVLRPVRIIQVKSKASGEIMRMTVDLGDKVQAGDLIAQVETRFLEQELNQAQADLENARVRIDVAEKQYERAKQLAEQDLVSRQDLDSAEQNWSGARAQMLRAEADVELSQERLADATVRAPVSGTIISKTVEEGTVIASSTSNVSGGTVLVEISDLSRLEVRTLVDEIDIGRVTPGLPVQSTVEAYPDRTFGGQVVKIEPQAVIDQQVTTFPVLSFIDNADGLLLPGMNADVEVVIHRRPRALTVPNEAVKDMNDAGTVANLLGLPFDQQAMRAEARTLLTGSEGGPGRVGGQAEAAEAGGEQGETELSNEDIDSSKMAGMSREEREEYMAGFTEEAQQRFRDQMRQRFAGAGGGGRPSGAGGGAAGGGAPGGGGFAGFGGGGSGGDSGGGVGMDSFGIGRAPQASVVFVMDEGQMVARQVMIGVQDWEYTEIVAGLEPGDEVVLLPSTSLLMSQQALRDRFASFGSPLGGGGRR